jgi:hypothetical protein
MSKCKEAYETLFAEPWMHERERSNLWQAAWNARGKVDVEICKEQSIRFAEAMNGKATYGAVKCEIAIKQEQCK